MNLKTVRARVLAGHPHLRQRGTCRPIAAITLDGVTSLDVRLDEGWVVDLVDNPCLHAEQYKSSEFPDGWPVHLFEKVAPDTPLFPDLFGRKETGGMQAHLVQYGR